MSNVEAARRLYEQCKDMDIDVLQNEEESHAGSKFNNPLLY
jgi:hypothetical protein